MLKPLEQWICDSCGKVIETHEKGMLIWCENHPEFGTEFRIVHKGSCDNNRDVYNLSWEIHWCLGNDGLSNLLSLLSAGPLIASAGADSSKIFEKHLPHFVDLMRRLQIPYYEEARQKFTNPDVLDEFSDANEVAPYQKESLLKIIKKF